MAGNLGGAVGSVPIGLQPIAIQTDWYINFQIGTDILTAAVDTTAAVLHQTHNIQSASMATSAATVGDVVFSQVCAVQATTIETSAADTTTPAVNQGQTLTTSGLTTTSVATTSPLLGYIHNLYGGALATTDVAFSTAALTQTQYFSTTDVETSAPTITTPSVSEIDHLTALVPTTGALEIGSATLAQTSNLTSLGLDLAPIDGAPMPASVTLVHVWHLFTSAEIATFSPVISTPNMPTQSHNLAAPSINTAALSFAPPTLIEAYTLHSEPLWSGNATFTSGFFFQAHNLHAPSIDNRFYVFRGEQSVIGATPMASMIIGGSSDSLIINSYNPYSSVALNQICHLGVYQSFDTSAMVVAPVVLDQKSILTTASVTTRAVEIQPTVFDQITVLGGTSFTLFNASISTPYFLQAHVLSALSNLDPVILQPLPGTFIQIIGQATLNQTGVLRPSGEVATSYVSVGATTLSQKALIEASGLSTAAARFTTATLDQTCVLFPTAITTSPVGLSFPIAISTHILSAEGIAGTAVPIESSVLIQHHKLKSDSFGPVSYFWAQSSGAHPMGFAPIAAPAHVAVPKIEISIAVLGERYTTPPNPVTTSSAELGAPIIRQSQALVAHALVAPAVEFSPVIVSEGNHLNTAGVEAAAPVFSTPDFRAKHFIYGVDLATGPPFFGAPKLAFRESYVALSITTFAADIGVPNCYSPKLAYATAKWTLETKTVASVQITATTSPVLTPATPLVTWSKTTEASASWTICAKIDAEWMIKDQIDG